MDVILYDFDESICCQMARLVLSEKGVGYRRHNIDIRGAGNEQFAPWYVALNPKAVVPTLRVGDTVITDTLRIAPYVDANFEGPDLSADSDETTRWMKRIMALHYGVLLYRELVNDDGVCPTVQERYERLVTLHAESGDPTGVIEARIAGNLRFQALLADSIRTDACVAEARDLVEAMNTALATHPFLAGDTYTMADSFATAALARFEAHGLHEQWWANGVAPHVADYYGRVQRRASWSDAQVFNTLAYHG